MKKVVANSMVLEGSLKGGAEIEPGTFHAKYSTTPNIALFGSDNLSDEEDISSPTDEDNNACSCLFLER